jgi:hypothetical protein
MEQAFSADVLVPLGVGAAALVVAIVIVVVRAVRARTRPTAAAEPTHADWTGESVGSPMAAQSAEVRESALVGAQADEDRRPVTVADMVAVREADTAPLPVQSDVLLARARAHRAAAEKAALVAAGASAADRDVKADATEHAEVGQSSDRPDGPLPAPRPAPQPRSAATAPPEATEGAEGAREGDTPTRSAAPVGVRATDADGAAAEGSAVEGDALAPADERPSAGQLAALGVLGAAGAVGVAGAAGAGAGRSTGGTTDEEGRSDSADEEPPEGGAPRTAAPEPAAPVAAAAEPVTPGQATPKEAAAEHSGPAEGAPSQAAGGQAAGDQAAPDQAVGGQAAPDQAAGGQAAPVESGARRSAEGQSGRELSGGSLPGEELSGGEQPRAELPAEHADPAGATSDPATGAVNTPAHAWPVVRTEQGEDEAGSGQAVAAAVQQALAARARAAQGGQIADPRRGDARDKLLAVLLDDPVRAVGATVDLQSQQVELAKLAEAMKAQRQELGAVVRRLAAAGLSTEQVAKLADLDPGEVTEMLEQPARRP